jgi:ABC-type transporter Mla subunit MlaD
MPGKDIERELSVDLEWPVDPLLPAPAAVNEHEREQEREPETEWDEQPPPDIETIIHKLERSVPPSARRAADDTAGMIDELSAQLDYVASEVVEALRAMNETTARLAARFESRIGDSERTQRKERERVLGHLDKQVEKMARQFDDALAAVNAQTDALVDQVAAELEALRRRIPTRSATAMGLDEDAIDDLVTRVADEVEIRLAALNPKSRPRRKS